MKRTFVIIFVWMNILSANTYAQKPDNDSILNKQLSRYLINYESLMQYRGVGRSLTSVSLEMLTSGLHTYVGANKNANMLIYHFSGSKLWTWLINPNEILAVDSVSTSAAELASLEQDFKYLLGLESKRNNLYANSRGVRSSGKSNGNAGVDSLQRRISAILFPKAIRQFLASTDSVQHLLILPVLNIASFPLYALQPFDNPSYLIDKVSIAIVPSVDDLLNYTVGHRSSLTYKGLKLNKQDSPLVIIGNPDYSACINEFNQLPGADKEADYTAKVLQTIALKGKEATKENVAKKMEKAEFLYFATHGISSNDAALDQSYLVLSGKDSCERLTAREIQTFRMHYKPLVVLSACQTGLGKTLPAGIVGLGRGFILGGAKNVVMSLWNVNDRATTDLMSLFIDELQVKHSFFPAVHLREAIVKYKMRNPDPASWAAFTLFGMPYLSGKLIDTE